MKYDPRPDFQHGVPLFIPLAASSLIGFALVVALILIIHPG